ncbi:MAG TPA: TIGR03118 family protein [Bryobacteraceae bacterium]|jgi:uncharacterized protein (TIGR03118 family)|nr:TIGR03118 family protein [Bryobacteraceae bacterium]
MPVFAAGANVYLQHNLVADTPGIADVTDPNLINPWGISISFTATGGSPFWISDNGTGKSTLYNGSGNITPLVVTIPSVSGASGTGNPTGQVQNNTTGFVLANGKPASFIFASEDGTITAWNGGTTASQMVDNSPGAVYKGLAIGSNANGPMLYAANFRAGKIDVFDGKFTPTTVTGGFVDTTVPANFAPFNIWALGGKLYVAYAKPDNALHDDVQAPGNGYVAVFDFNGTLITHLVSNGPLNSPWGLAIAPSTFGAFGGDLLVGNFGDGKINAFDPATGALLGTLQDANGNPIVIGGLWALLFGNNGSGGDKNTLYFTAGPGGAQHGLLGSLAPPAAILGIQNGASQLPGPIAPGEVAVLTGLSIGPSPTASASIPTSGAVSASLSGVSVTFNGWPAPILYTSASQTSVLVPYELGGFQSANLVVKYRGQTASLTVPVALSAPGIFTLNFTGSGQAVAINSDGTLNGTSNPATAGTVITLFATGEGPTYPPGEDGVVNDRIIRTPQLPVILTIGGQQARVLYAGTAFGSVQGVLQVEALIPSGVTGTVPLELSVGSVNSQTTATITVK